MRRIRTAAVLGAGTMGAQIAAHLANAGVPTLLLDVTAEAAVQGLARARALKPDPFSHQRHAHADPHRQLSTTCRGLGALRLDHRSGRRAARREAGAARTGRTRESATRRSSRRTPPAFRCRGSPRAAPTRSAGGGWGRTSSTRRAICALLEVIPTADTDPAIVRTIVDFADRRLGKGVVLAKDTPGFIANRIGLFGLMQVFKAMAAAGLHGRGGRCDHRPGHRPAAERDLPDDGPGGRGHSRGGDARISGSGSTRPSGPPSRYRRSSRSWSAAGGPARRADAASIRRRRPARSRRSTSR